MLSLPLDPHVLSSRKSVQTCFSGCLLLGFCPAPRANDELIGGRCSLSLGQRHQERRVCTPRRRRGAGLQGQDVAPRRLEPRRQEALPAHLQQRGLELGRRQDLDARKPNTFLDATFDPTKDWEGRHTAGYVVYKDKMWIVGGDVNQGHYHYDVWNSADGKTWTYVNKDKPVPWGPRALHYTVVFKDKIWVIGGQTMPQFAKADGGVLPRHLELRPTASTGRRSSRRSRSGRSAGMIGGSAVFKDRIWILGGGTYDTPKTPDAQVLQRRLELRRRRDLDAARRDGPVGAAAVSRCRRLRRPALGAGRLQQDERQPQRRLALRRRRQLARSAEHAVEAAPRRQRLRPRRRAVDGRRQQHGERRVEAGADALTTQEFFAKNSSVRWDSAIPMAAIRFGIAIAPFRVPAM